MASGGVVEVVFLGNDRQYQETLERMGVTTDAAGKAISDKFGSAGTNAAERFTTGIDKGTSRLGSIFQKLGNEASQFGIPFSNQLTKIGKDLSDVQTKSKGVLEAMSAIGAIGVAAVAGVAVESVHLADGFDRAQSVLETSVKNSGNSWDQYKGQVAAAAKTSSALVVANAAEVDQALQELTTATQSPATALKDLTAAENIAAMKHISLADAAQGLVKVYGGSVRVLQQWGINLDIGSGKLHSIQAAQEAVTKAQLSLKTAQAEVSDGQLQGVAASSRLAGAQLTLRDAELNLKQSQNAIPAVIDTINQRTHNAAQTLGQTLPGEIQIAKNSIHNLGIAFGEALLPAVNKALGVLSKGAAFFEQNKSAAIALGVAIGGPLVAAMTVFSGRAALAALESLGKLATGFVTLSSTALSKLPVIGSIFATTSADAEVATVKQISALDILDKETITSLALQENQWKAYAVEVQATSAQVLAATGEMDAGLARDAADAQAQAAIYGNALRSIGVSAEASAAIVSTADVEMVTATTAASRGIMAALGSTGIGLIVVGLGIAVTELATHWDAVWPIMETAAKHAANGIIDVINAIVAGAEHAANALIDIANVLPGVNVHKINVTGTTIGKIDTTRAPSAASVANAGLSGSGGLSAAALNAQVQKLLGTNASGTAGGGSFASPTGGLGGYAYLQDAAKQFLGSLSRAIAGGTTFSQQGRTVQALTAATSTSNAAREASLVNSLNATQNPTLVGLAQSIETTWQNATTKLTTIIDSDTTKGQSELQKLQSAQMATSMRQVLRATDSAAKAGYTQLVNELKSTHSSALAGLVKQLETAWKGATDTLKSIKSDLKTETLANTIANQAAIVGIQTTASQQAGAAAVTVSGLGSTKTANQLQAAATAIQDAAKIQTDEAQRQTTAITDAMNIASASATAQSTQIKDAATLLTDAANILVQSISAQTTAMQDAANAQVTAIQDQTQTQVDTLGEKGLYGLQLVAQQAKVALDQQKAIDDANIAAAQAHLDQVTAQTNQQVSLAQQRSDQDQQVNDASIAQAQMSALMAQQANDANIAQAQQAADAAQAQGDADTAAAQAQADTVAITSAITDANAQAAANAAALQAQSLSAQAAQLSTQSQFETGAAQRSDQAQSQLLQAQASAATAGAAATVQAIQNQTTLANQNAQNALQQAQATASQQEANAQAALAQAQAAASTSNAQQQATLTAIQNAVQVQAAQDAANLAAAQANAQISQAQAQQQLVAIQTTASKTEATLQSTLAIDQEMASVQFKGTGAVVNIYGLPVNNAAVIGSEVNWQLRTLLNLGSAA